MKALVLTVLITFAAGTRAQTAVIYSGVQDIPIPTNFEGVSVNIFDLTSFDGDPAPDWSDSQVNFFFGGDGVFSGPRFLPVRTGTGATDPILSLMPGDLVETISLTGPGGNGASQDHIGNALGQFPSGVESYLGFKLDLTGSGDFVNGFMRVTLTNGSSEGLIHDWAYSDTPGETITVGVIPEPSTPVLVGALGLALAFRRKR
ncbi:PEP-CTERM sorting domain-containing protein [Haloferula sargassicola]|uniref:PEP-CTERM protein-sorting domain-containing protein n=1 Tax=Haloferula sargassicola TaxID=490096 RepID=A0ABP9UU91_9BACT